MQQSWQNIAGLRTDRAARAFIDQMHSDIRQLSAMADPPLTISEALIRWNSWWGHEQYCGNATADTIWRVSKYIDLMSRRHAAGKDPCGTDEDEDESDSEILSFHARR
jgi:hypothetical protein